MYRPCAIVVIVVVAFLTLTGSKGACSHSADEPASRKAHAESLRMRCGPRAAWAFGLCCGVSLGHDATMALFEKQPDAVSLRELVEFLNSKGISCEARCLSPSDLTKENCPSIALLAPATVTDHFGHFVVVVASDEDGVTVIEPQVGRKERWTWRFFSDHWTGHCILRSPRVVPERRVLCLCILTNIIGLAYICFRR